MNLKYGILIIYKINKDSTNQSSRDIKEIKWSDELIKHKNISVITKLLNKMPIEYKTKIFTQQNQKGGSLK